MASDPVGKVLHMTNADHPETTTAELAGAVEVDEELELEDGEGVDLDHEAETPDDAAPLEGVNPLDPSAPPTEA